MVSRQTTRPLRKLVPAVAIGASALLGIVGCSAGQVAQTAEMPPAVNGNSAQAGDLMLRNVLVAFPEDSEPYAEGDDAPLLLSIINTGLTDDELVAVTSPAGEVEMIGNPAIPGGTALQVVRPDENAATESEMPATTTPESPGTSGTETSEPTTTTAEDATPGVVGTMSLVITGLTTDLPFGKNVPVTFEFAEAGKVTVELPIDTADSPRHETEAAEEGH